MEGSTDDHLIVAAEGERYAAELVFVHGLWTTPAIWGAVARGFAQRGWHCVLFDARRAAAQHPAAGIAGWTEALLAFCRERAAPPIVLGHDAGGLAALALAERNVARAAIAVAPLLEGASTLVPATVRYAAWLRGAPIAPPALGSSFFAGLGDAACERLAGWLVPESTEVIRSLRGRTLAPGAPAIPTLLVAQHDDTLVAPALVAVTARGIEAHHEILPGNHWPMLAERIDAWMTSVHRWLIRQVGAQVLLLRGDEDLREE